MLAHGAVPGSYVLENAEAMKGRGGAPSPQRPRDLSLVLTRCCSAATCREAAGEGALLV